MAVEKKCPVAAHFGVEGIGEGIVWSATWKGNNYRFKVKGEEHSNSKVKTIAPIDIEKLNSIQEFVEFAVHEGRLSQGIDVIFLSKGATPVRERTGDFVKWVTTDVFKEELDTLVKNGLEPKEVSSALSKKASKWFMVYLDKMVGL